MTLNSPFDHFILTRYNLPFKRSGVDEMNEEWMNHRFQLFRSYCFPSVVNQKNQNFTWLIYVSQGTQEKHIREIRQLIGAHKNIKLLTVDSLKNFLPAVKKHIDEHLKSSRSRYLITTRLDNDDAIRNDFVDLIQRRFSMQEYCLADLVDGYCLLVKSNLKLSKRRLEFNQFLSLIENVSDFKTVMHHPGHRYWKILDTKREIIAGQRAWIQIVHDRNVLNSFKGMFLTNSCDLKKEFGIDIDPRQYHSGVWDKIVHFVKTGMGRARRYVGK